MSTRPKTLLCSHHSHIRYYPKISRLVIDPLSHPVPGCPLFAAVGVGPGDRDSIPHSGFSSLDPLAIRAFIHLKQGSSLTVLLTGKLTHGYWQQHF